MWKFYVLQSQKDPEWFYKGSTNNLESRIKQHNNGKVESTVPYRPLTLVYYEAYLTERAAREREINIKKSGSLWIPIRKRILESLKEK